MKPKDPIWNFYEVMEEGSKKITKGRECGTVVSAKSDRLKTHREKCAGLSLSQPPEKVIETNPKVDIVDDVPVAPETPKRKRTYEEMNSQMNNKQGSLLMMLTAMRNIILFAVCFTVSQAADWDIFTFTQEWPTTVCNQAEQEHHKCVIPDVVNTWSIHGLWPTKTGTEGPHDCRNVTFNPDKIKNITSELTKFWANMYADTSATSFWEHEWSKHGTCAMDLPATANEYLYFKKALDVMKIFDATMLFQKYNIVPSDTKVYNVSQLENAIKEQTGVTPLIECAYDEKTRKHMVYEVEICLSKTFKPVSCDSSNRSARRHHHHYSNSGSNGSSRYSSNCPHDGFLYQPIPRSIDVVG